MSSKTQIDPEAQLRIEAAFSPDRLRQCGQQVIDQLADHLSGVQNSEGSVLNWAEPTAGVEQARQWLDAGAASQDRLAERMQRLMQEILDRGHNLHDPRYIGHQVPASMPLAGLFTAVAAVLNQVMAIYEMGPWSTAVEEAVVGRLGELIGWPRGEFTGLATNGGSLANLTALLTARNVACPELWESGCAPGQPDRRPVLITHAESHYCVTRAAGILGLGTGQVVKVGLDERRRMDPQRLDVLLTECEKEQRPVIAVCAAACATPIGAFDPLQQIADICERHRVWMHVDAAHGGAALFSRRHRPLLDGLERADSIVWDAHKMLFVPALCAFVFYRNPAHRFRAFQQEAPYLFDPAAPENIALFDSGLRTIECTKQSLTYGLWGVWSLYGPQLFADLVETTFARTHQLYELLQVANDFETLHEPECNILAFRYRPHFLANSPPEQIGRFQLALRRRLIQSGEYYIVPTQKDGIPALRVTLMNPLTNETHLKGLLAAIRRMGAEVSL